MKRKGNTIERAQDYFEILAARGRSLLSIVRQRSKPESPLRRVGELAGDLLSIKGDTSGAVLAEALVSGYATLGTDDRLQFLNMIADSYGAEPTALAKAIDAYQSQPNTTTLKRLRTATESRCQQLLRRINLAENGMLALIRMREDALCSSKRIEKFDGLDSDFSHVFTPWFNIGFLDLKRLSWDSPASLLHKIISYEAVHEIQGWEDLRRRLEPEDRLCYAYFHPRIPDEPLIFVEIALTAEVPASIGDVLAEDRTILSAAQATTAVFYSISNCQEGLRGIPFGNFLIKRVVELLKREYPQLRSFVTLSPAPGFAAWLNGELSAERGLLSPADRAVLSVTTSPGWSAVQASETECSAIQRAAARYYLHARTSRDEARDPVARFHLGNGAQLEHIRWLGDRSPKGLGSSHGLMVNYRYDPRRIQRNYEAYTERKEVMASNEVRGLLAS